MKIETIKQDDWKNFLETFNKEKKDNLFSLVSNEDIEKPVADNLKLKEISIETMPGEFNNTAYIIGYDENREVNYLIERVKNIRHEFDDEGKESFLHLYSDNNKSVSIFFNNK
jgi:hypothetical protein